MLMQLRSIPAHTECQTAYLQLRESLGSECQTAYLQPRESLDSDDRYTGDGPP